MSGMSTIIYVVTSGEYSGYGINGIFDTKEKAQVYIEYCEKVGTYNGRCDIEEWELNQYYDQIARGLIFYRVIFENILEGDAIARVNMFLDEELESSRKNHITEINNYIVNLWAKDEQAALKIANERRMRYLIEHLNGK